MTHSTFHSIHSTHAVIAHLELTIPERFASYRTRIAPGLHESGYHYFLACDSKDYQQHQEWCQDHCEAYTLPHCDVWQVGRFYPRAFASQADAALFRLNFEAHKIGGNE